MVELAASTSTSIARKPVGLGRLLAFLLPATTAMYAVYQGAQVILIPAQVEQFDPANKVTNLALLTTFAAIASMVAIPLGGALSDRTRSRYGRRTPWIVGMSVISGVLMIAMGYAGNLVLFGVVYTVLWFSSNMYQGALSAILPDRVPVDRRGLASSVIGLGTPFGVLLGVNVASHVGQAAGYTIIAVVLVVASFALVIGAREPSAVDLPAADAASTGRGAAVRSFLAAFSTRDFTLAFVSRFALFLSYFTVSGFLYYTLSDYIGADQIPDGNVAVAVGTLTSITVIAWVLVASVCGWIADRVDRRKLFVGIAAIGLGITMFVPIILPTWNGMLIYSIFSGIFIGTYFAVDLAVMSLVLPNKDREGRDLGILAVATGLPSILSALIAGTLISVFGGYVALYLFGTVCAVVAGITVLGIKRVR